ncbi:MAG: hypothetical protein ABFD69_07050 [Candidatus Sumerlaeia bacterium]
MGRKPTPSPSVDSKFGCGLATIIFSALTIRLFIYWGIWGLAPVPGIIAAVVIGYWLHGRVLLLRCMILRAKRGIRGIIVYSNSPNWQAYVETNWLPMLRDRFLILNRSHEEHRSGTLSARVYRHFCPQNENHCPAIILFRGLMHPCVYRCYYAFLDFKHGNPKALRELEAHLLKRLGITPPEKEEAPSHDGA